MIPCSPITPFQFRTRTLFVKRDELIDPLFSGNKYRKLYHLLQTPASRFHTLYSYGGAQSNAMLSIAALCHQKGWAFHYTARTLPSLLQQREPQGNLQQALKLGMLLHQVSEDRYQNIRQHLQAACRQQDGAIFLPQGAAAPSAEAGIKVLSAEITQWQKQQALPSLTIATPSGTGTTAFYLARNMPKNRILTTAVIGSDNYLRTQIKLLGCYPPNLQIIPQPKKFHFAKPYPEFLQLYRELLASGIAFDLNYGIPMWHALSFQLPSISQPLLYLHSGGLPGNASMLERYQRKYPAMW